MTPDTKPNATGPKTTDGKRIAARNATTHGLFARDIVLRHETALHRQIDMSVNMMGRELPHMTEGRARRRALADFHTTELECRRDDASDWAVTEKARQYLTPRPFPPSLDPATLDTENCQNEPAPCKGMACHAPTLAPPEVGAGARSSASSEEVSTPKLAHENCQNEPDPDLVGLPIIGAGGASSSSPAGGSEWACPLGGVSSPQN